MCCPDYPLSPRRIMEEIPVCALVKVLSRTASYADSHLGAQICLLEAAKALMKEQTSAFFNDVGQLPVLVSDASDGTPIKTRRRVAPNTPSGEAGAQVRHEGHRGAGPAFLRVVP